MTLRPLYGHEELRTRLATSAKSERLPASLLLHGARGVGKQRLAIWLAQLLLCERAAADGLEDPCGACQQCRYSLRLVHPDLHWFFPRPSLKDSSASDADVAADMSEAIAERLAADGLWAPPSGSEGIYVKTMKALVHRATLRPAMAKRAVFIVGDAERMVSQESSPEAANTMLKLLEEPPPQTTLILTSSEPLSLLPTIRSRMVSIRVPSLSRAAVEAFLDDAAVQRRLPGTVREESIGRASGAPGVLLATDSTAVAFGAARRLLDAALQPSTPAGAVERIKAAARQGVAGARGAFSDMLDALTVILHDRVRRLTNAGQDSDARRTAMAMILVEEAKLRANGNVSPQLLGASLIASLHNTLRP